MAPLALALATFLIAIAALVALAHVVRWPSRDDPPPVPMASAGRAVRRYTGVLVAVDAAAILALVVLLFRAPEGSAEMWLAGGAALCVAAMIAVWAALIRPLNATIVAWSPDVSDAHWHEHHRRWLLFHRLRLALAIIAIALLLMGVLARPAH